MPKQVDADRRRSEFVDATWRVITREGLRAVTLRRVAAEAQCTTGSLTHYFTSREALLIEALRAAHHDAAARIARVVEEIKGNSKRLEAVVLEALPLDGTRMMEWKTRLAVWAEASASPVLRRENTRRYRQWSDLLARCLSPIIGRRGDLRREVVLLTGLVDGLALRMVLHEEGQTGTSKSEATADLRSYLRRLQGTYR